MWVFIMIIKGDEMYYELYADAIFLINFIMNLCLLYLIYRSTGRTATWTALIMGAMAGAVCFIIPFIMFGPFYVRLAAGGLCSAFVMIMTCFKVRSVRAFMKLMFKLIRYTFLLGGGVLFITGIISSITAKPCRTECIIVTGIAMTAIIAAVSGRKKDENICDVILVKDGRSVKTRALIDSGNSLIEPISKKPAAVLEKRLFDELWGDTTAPFRAIPFHSVGKTHGMLKGYFIDELVTDMGGLKKGYENVCVAVCADDMPVTDIDGKGIGIILNPDILKA
jgi:stage II sporulation protein GA (sporulation sigma-E factor processing peptidase)